MTKGTDIQQKKERPPIVVVVGHVDHGKSTLLDYIRKTNVVGGEAGGITQHTYAYDISHKTKEGQTHDITFIDTPGHAAFKGSRKRGTTAADIVILIVSAEEGVKEQTLECLKLVEKAEIPYIIALNKIDRPNANPDKAKQGLAEAGVLVEGYGGKIPCVEISAKEGTGIDDLLDMILLIAEIEELTGDFTSPAHGYVLESHIDPRIGVSATLIIRDGIMQTGSFMITEGKSSKIKRIEDMAGKIIKEGGPSKPIKVLGLSEIPSAGIKFITSTDKNEADKLAASQKNTENKESKIIEEEDGDVKAIVPVILRSDVLGTLEALTEELRKLETEKVKIKFLQSGVGNISESDMQIASAADNPIIIGFNVKTDKIAGEIIDSENIEPHFFDIIYKATEFMEEEIKKRTPKIKIEEVIGRARIIRIFNQVKKKQVIGASFLAGEVSIDSECNIVRNETVVGRCKISELQIEKIKVKIIEDKINFGALLESKITLALGDILEAIKVVEK